MTKLRVGVIFGGKSAEHEVSLQSAKNIVDAIDKEKFDVTLLGIDKQGQWHINDASNYLLNAENPALIALNRSNKNVALIPGQEKQQLIEAGSAGALGQLDVIFPIVHGTLGEDGSLQGLLRMANMPFVGAGVLGSAVSMDKDVTKRLLRDAGLAVAPFVTLTRANRAGFTFEQLSERLGLPLFVKPAKTTTALTALGVGIHNLCGQHVVRRLQRGSDGCTLPCGQRALPLERIDHLPHTSAMLRLGNFHHRAQMRRQSIKARVALGLLLDQCDGAKRLIANWKL
mgnify:CR=1 FL=1